MSDRGVIDWQTKKIDINPPLIQINQKLFDFTELKGEIQVYGALSMRCTSGYGLCIVVRLANFKTVQQTVQQLFSKHPWFTQQKYIFLGF